MESNTDPNCLFCKIVAGKIPCYKLYEDDHVLAFLDLFPVAHGHSLMITKYHAAGLHELPSDVAQNALSKLPMIGKAVMEGMGVEGYNVVNNNGKDSG